MLNNADKNYIKTLLEENNKTLLKGIAEYIQGAIIKILNDHEKRLDRLEKSAGGFPPMSS